MNLYKPTFKDRKTGQKRETPQWYLDFRDHHGTRQRFAGSADRHETEAFGRMLTELVKCRKRSVQPADKLWTWLMGLPADVQAKLVALDLADKRWFAALSQAERLSAWVDDYENWQRTSKARTGFHRSADSVQTVMHRIRAIVDGCGFRTWGDIRKSAVESYIGGLSIGRRTHVGYCRAIKQFCTWCVRDGRGEFSPVQFLDLVTVPDKETRRPLGFDEVCRLLAAAVKAPKRFGLTGMERGILYRVGIESGFRRNELAHVTAGSFDPVKATLRLPAECCKDRCDAEQPISMALASRLADYLASRQRTDSIIPLHSEHTARMIQADATDAGLPIVDDEGRELVFHSLRHTLRTELEKARVSDGVIDSIMRHKPAGVGKRFYRHVHEFERREAIERLPEYPWPADLAEQQATKAVS